ncbi:hypothetical protein ACJX0J_014611 [Zea mays]
MSKISKKNLEQAAEIRSIQSNFLELMLIRFKASDLKEERMNLLEKEWATLDKINMLLFLFSLDNIFYLYFIYHKEDLLICTYHFIGEYNCQEEYFLNLDSSFTKNFGSMLSDRMKKNMCLAYFYVCKVLKEEFFNFMPRMKKHFQRKIILRIIY